MRARIARKPRATSAASARAARGPLVNRPKYVDPLPDNAASRAPSRTNVLRMTLTWSRRTGASSRAASSSSFFRTAKCA